jgi:hypothetical protein
MGNSSGLDGMRGSPMPSIPTKRVKPVKGVKVGRYFCGRR